MDERCTLFVGKSDSTTLRQSVGTLEDPDEGKDGESESRPVDECG